jgi:hypothetical protein
LIVCECSAGSVSSEKNRISAPSLPTVNSGSQMPPGFAALISLRKLQLRPSSSLR